MSFALVMHDKYGGWGGANGGTSLGADSTGGDLLIVAVFDYFGGTQALPTDNKGNTFVGGTSITDASGEARVRICYIKNPTVGSSHTVTFSETGCYPSGGIQVWNGSDLSAPFEAESAGGSHNGIATTIQPGTTGTLANSTDLVVTASCWGPDGSVPTPSIDSGFTISDSVAYSAGTNEGGAFAYNVPASTSALSPTTTWYANSIAAISAIFKAGAGGVFFPYQFYMNNSAMTGA